MSTILLPFLLYFELLVAAVKEHKTIGGIALLRKDFKSTMLKDDATFGTLNSFRELFEF